MKSYPVQLLKNLKKKYLKEYYNTFKSTVTKVLKSSIVINNIKNKDCCSVATNGVAPYLVKLQIWPYQKMDLFRQKKLQTEILKIFLQAGMLR